MATYGPVSGATGFGASTGMFASYRSGDVKENYSPHTPPTPQGGQQDGPGSPQTNGSSGGGYGGGQNGGYDQQQASQSNAGGGNQNRGGNAYGQNN